MLSKCKIDFHFFIKCNNNYFAENLFVFQSFSWLLYLVVEYKFFLAFVIFLYPNLKVFSVSKVSI